MFAAPAFGALQVAVPRFSPRTFCEAVEKERISQTVLVPAMIHMLTDFADASRFDLSSLEVMAYGGSSLPVEVHRRTRQMLPGVELIQVYGMTETGFLTGLEAKEESIGQLLNACGRSCPGVDVQVVDPSSGRPVGAGQPGEIVARGANVMLGYWNHPDWTAQAFRNNFFRTGDIGYQDTAGCLFIADRLKQSHR
jgi:acyl-CoA synthetase (AMP-forming)/AMP-acid ligase II